jgi:demethylmenaquinone methyltransferase/2-methoxy-6-polyprenyl-1,4-benzoquinol methylase
MFDRVAPRYDLVNTLLSGGQDAHWRRVAARAAAVGPGRVALDGATGTGKLAGELAAFGAEVVALDFSVPMLAAGAGGGAPGAVRWVAGDGTRLPLPERSVDAVTIAFGLRNLGDVDAGLAEFARVARPGARLVVLEFSQPPRAAVRRAYHALLRAGVPAVARAVASEPRAYQYLAESIVAWPDASELAARIAAAGWTRVGIKRLAAGGVAVHRGVRPGG